MTPDEQLAALCTPTPEEADVLRRRIGKRWIDDDEDSLALIVREELPTVFRLAVPRIAAQVLRDAATKLAALAPKGDVVGLDAVYVEAIHDAYVGLNQWATSWEQKGTPR